ncbi:MAG: aspartate aminotransferase family protein [Verrucomicrobiota bacterium]
MNTRQTLSLLRRFESRNVTFADPGGGWPIVWDRARGVHVWDAEGRRYLDLTAAFGVAAAGHSNRLVAAAASRQADRLLHAMGDVHPHPLKAALARELSRITFESWTRGLRQRLHAKTIFCNSGFEAVEAGLKTALLATGRKGLIAFHGAYHGLGYGTLNVTAREHFRGPFRPQLREFAEFHPFPVASATPAELRRLEQRLASSLRTGRIGAVLVEPVQARGGIRIPPADFLPRLRRLCTRHGALLILDEIYTGFGRTGRWFACEHSGTVPDLVCLGKALTGGFPLSACVGRSDLMDAAWPASTGEAIHTSTYLGHPVGCAMALAQISEIRKHRLCQRSARLGDELIAALRRLRTPGFQLEARGLGLMAGLEFRTPAGAPAGTEVFRVVRDLLRRGFILLPEGEQGEVLSLTPPLTISSAQLAAAVRAIAAAIAPPTP